MSFTLVQGTGAQQTNSAAALSKAFASNVTAGNIVVVAVTTFSDKAPIVTDNLGNEYVPVAGTTDGANQYVGIFAANNVSGGALTVTATLRANSYMALAIGEFSGAANVVARAARAAVGNSTAPNTGSVPIGATTDLLVGALMDGSWTPSITPGTGFSSVYTVSGTGSVPPVSLVYQTGLGSNTAVSWTLGVANDWQVCAASLRVEAAGGGGSGGISRARQVNGA